MASVLSVEAGGPETLVLSEQPIPRPRPGEVRVQVRAVGLNYPDLLIIEDRYQFKPERPFSPGAEISGIIDAVGEGVTQLRPGQRVMAMVGWGGMAEYACVNAERCSPIPDAMPFDQAAAFLMTYGTSYHALNDRARLLPGETLLVLGAAGGVGLAAVELGKAMGARVIAAASSQEKLETARELGADDTVLYERGPLGREGQRELAGRFKAAIGSSGAAVIYDPVGGEYAEPALRSIGWEGRYLVVGFPAGIPALPFNLALLKSCDIRGVFWGAAIERDPVRHAQAVDELLAMYSAGKIRPFIYRVFELAEVSQALKLLASRQVMGKVVITIP